MIARRRLSGQASNASTRERGTASRQSITSTSGLAAGSGAQPSAGAARCVCSPPRCSGASSGAANSSSVDQIVTRNIADIL